MDLTQAYKILEIPQNSSMPEVKQAHRDLAQIWHPDRHAQNERLKRKACEKMKQLNAAYDCICLHLDSARATEFTNGESEHKSSTDIRGGYPGTQYLFLSKTNCN
jgi:DnaJ-class molecular chaperone